MKDIFKTQSRKEFMDMADAFLQSLHEKFPECNQTTDAQTYFKGVVLGSERAETETIDGWVRNMMAPLNKKKVLYSKAVERITGDRAVCYHACVYKDADGFGSSTTSKLLKDIDCETKYKDERMTEDDKALFWKYIEKLNASAFEFTGEPVPRVPSREEIRENIAMNRKSPADADQPSVSKAFASSLNKLYDRHNKSTLKATDDAQIEEAMTKWAELGKQVVEDGKTLSSLVSTQSKAAEAVIRQEFGLNEFEEEDWKLVQNLYSYAAVGNAIPQRMMTRIEDLAGKIADDIVTGKKDMSSVDLTEIGHQVLAGCSPEDMQKFAGNLDELLPVIGKFANSTP